VRVADQKVRQLHSSIPIEVTNYPSFVSKLQDLRGSLLKLVEIASETKGQIRRFHIPGESRTHYHQSLYSIVHRHEETISSILDLLLAKRNQQAVALTRMLYEGFLNFYIDWLSPEHVGPMLQLAALVRRRQLFGDDGNPSEDKAPNIDDVLGKGFADLIQTTAHKARISPLGAHFHELVYPWLSFAAHQDYGTTQEHSSLLEHSFDESEANLPDKLVLWIDVITAALVVRVLADVGSSVDSLPSFAARK
jgi:hypothetical protein